MDPIETADEMSQGQDLKQEIERSEGENPWDSQETGEDNLASEEAPEPSNEESTEEIEQQDPGETQDDTQEKTPHEDAGDRRVLKFSEYFTRAQ